MPDWLVYGLVLAVGGIAGGMVVMQLFVTIRKKLKRNDQD